MMIDINKKYRTKSGRDVRIICVDRNSDNPIVALIKEYNGRERVMSYNSDGVSSIYDDDEDLIEVKPYSDLTVGESILVSNNGINFVKRSFAGVSSDGKCCTRSPDKCGYDVWAYICKYELIC